MRRIRRLLTDKTIIVKTTNLKPEVYITPQVEQSETRREVIITKENMMTPTIISYYSDFTENDKYYENFAITLMQRCTEFGISHHIENLQSKGSYKSNCLMKPGFILKKLTELKKPIIWIDCDTNFKEPFPHFNNITHDIGMATHSGDMQGIKASPLYFNYSVGAFKILREWYVHTNRALEKDIFELDHDALKHYVLPLLTAELQIHLLNDNWRDFCDGRYITNGNSIVPGKSEVHRRVMSLGQENRLVIAADVPTIGITFHCGEDNENSMSNLYSWLSNISGCNRFRIDLIGNREIEELDSYKKVFIESGGSVSLENKVANMGCIFNLDISDIGCEIKDWDKYILEQGSIEKDPKYLFNNKLIDIQWK